MNEYHTLYFAYGSNMNRVQMSHRCPGATSMGRAYLEDYRFIINQRGYATVVPSSGDRIEGVLWEVGPDHLCTLDSYEGHQEGIYDRCYREVETIDGIKQMALVYIDHLQTEIAVPNEGYLERVIEGAIDHVLPESYIETLKVFGEKR